MDTLFKNYQHLGVLPLNIWELWEREYWTGWVISWVWAGNMYSPLPHTKTNMPWFSKESDSNWGTSAVVSEVVNLFPDEIWQEINGLTEWILLGL